MRSEASPFIVAVLGASALLMMTSEAGAQESCAVAAHSDALPPPPPKPEDAERDIAISDAELSSPPKDDASISSSAHKPEVPTQSKSDYLHDGLFLRMSVGPVYAFGELEGGLGAYNYSETNFRTDWQAAGVVTEIAVGGSPFDGLVVAGRLSTYFLPAPSFDNTDSDGSELDIEPMFMPVFGGMIGGYPFPGHGFHIFANAGITFADIDDAAGSIAGASMLGGVFGGAIGFEGWVSEQWSIGLQLRVDAGLFDSEESAPDTTMDFIAPQAQLTFTYH